MSVDTLPLITAIDGDTEQGYLRLNHKDQSRSAVGIPCHDLELGEIQGTA